LLGRRVRAEARGGLARPGRRIRLDRGAAGAGGRGRRIARHASAEVDTGPGLADGHGRPAGGALRSSSPALSIGFTRSRNAGGPGATTGAIARIALWRRRYALPLAALLAARASHGCRAVAAATGAAGSGRSVDLCSGGIEAGWCGGLVARHAGARVTQALSVLTACRAGRVRGRIDARSCRAIACAGGRVRAQRTSHALNWRRLVAVHSCAGVTCARPRLALTRNLDTGIGTAPVQAGAGRHIGLEGTRIDAERRGWLVADDALARVTDTKPVGAPVGALRLQHLKAAPSVVKAPRLDGRQLDAAVARRAWELTVANAPFDSGVRCRRPNTDLVGADLSAQARDAGRPARAACRVIASGTAGVVLAASAAVGRRARAWIGGKRGQAGDRTSEKWQADESGERAHGVASTGYGPFAGGDPQPDRRVQRKSREDQRSNSAPR
jgi:hypothetical protein